MDDCVSHDEYVIAIELLNYAAHSLGFPAGAVTANDSTNGTITPDLYSEAIEAAEALCL